MDERGVVYTVGHSDRTGPQFVELLRSAGVERVVDVRRFPASRRHPQFSRATLERHLEGAGLAYTFLGRELGGRRKQSLSVDASPNRALTDVAFRNYADAMSSGEFRAGVASLEALARRCTVVLMCAERDWWRCHRNLLADLLVARNWQVTHLVANARPEVHTLSQWARVSDGELSYPSLL